MIAEPTRTSAHLSQRAIYDERYKAGDYDRRSAVRVLTAEHEALSGAVERALRANQAASKISLFDFGYGTGRVTNEWIESSAEEYLDGRNELRVVAYDVSCVGLQKAQEDLRPYGFESVGPLEFAPQEATGYIAGSVRKEQPGLTITVVFVHGCEDQLPEEMRKLALRANDGEPYLLTTSWYSGLGHVPGDALRRDYFRELAKLTAPLGEIVLAMSATGDLHELQPEWAEKLADGTTGGFPIEKPGDVIYSTELGQANFYHVFDNELNEYMEAVTSADQHWWVKGIRYPGEEFDSREAEQANYRKVVDANEMRKYPYRWSAADYQIFHTVAAFRSSLNPEEGSGAR